MLLFLSLVLLILSSVNSSIIKDILKPLSIPLHPTGSCPRYNTLVYQQLKQCPIMKDSCCTSKLPFDEEYKGTLTCNAVGSFPNNTLHLISPEDFLQMTKERDSCGRPCAKVADRFGELAEIFPNIVVLAVDVASREPSVDTLISHYGIAATPVIVLWENGYPRYKVTETPGDFDALVRVLQHKSDLRPAKNWTKDSCLDGSCEAIDAVHTNTSNVLKQTFNIEEQMQSFDWYLIIAAIALLIQCLYFFEAKRQDGIPWKNLNFGF